VFSVRHCTQVYLNEPVFLISLRRQHRAEFIQTGVGRCSSSCRPRRRERRQLLNTAVAVRPQYEQQDSLGEFAVSPAKIPTHVSEQRTLVVRPCAEKQRHQVIALARRNWRGCWHGSQSVSCSRAHRRGRRHSLPARLQAGLQGDRVEATDGNLSVGAIADWLNVKNPDSPALWPAPAPMIRTAEWV